MEGGSELGELRNERARRCCHLYIYIYIFLKSKVEVDTSPVIFLSGRWLTSFTSADSL